MADTVYKVTGKGIERVEAVTDPALTNAVYCEVAFTFPEGTTLEEVQSAIFDARTEALRAFRSDQKVQVQ